MFSIQNLVLASVFCVKKYFDIFMCHSEQKRISITSLLCFCLGCFFCSNRSLFALCAAADQEGTYEGTVCGGDQEKGTTGQDLISVT